MRNDSQPDCFLSNLSVIFDKLNITERFLAVMTLTYNFYYVSTWKSLNDNIIFPYKKYDVINCLEDMGVRYNELDNKEDEKAFTLASHKVVAIETDGYLCPWHPAYLSYHVKHHMLLLEKTSHEIILLEPLLLMRKVTISNDEFIKLPIIFSEYYKIENVSFDINSYTQGCFLARGENMANGLKLFEIFHQSMMRLL